MDSYVFKTNLKQMLSAVWSTTTTVFSTISRKFNWRKQIKSCVTVIPKRFALNGDRQSEDTGNDLSCDYQAEEFSWKEDLVLKEKFSSSKRRKEAKKNFRGERERGGGRRETGVRQSEIKRQWRGGSSWRSPASMKMGQSRLSLCPCRHHFQKQTRAPFKHARPSTCTRASQTHFGHSGEVTVPGLSGSWVMASCGWHGNQQESTAGHNSVGMSSSRAALTHLHQSSRTSSPWLPEH